MKHEQGTQAQARHHCVRNVHPGCTFLRLPAPCASSAPATTPHRTGNTGNTLRETVTDATLHPVCEGNTHAQCDMETTITGQSTNAATCALPHVVPVPQAGRFNRSNRMNEYELSATLFSALALLCLYWMG